MRRAVGLVDDFIPVQNVIHWFDPFKCGAHTGAEG
jgi:hypothetical protein